LKELLGFDPLEPLVWGRDPIEDARRIDALIAILRSCPEIVKVEVITVQEMNYMLQVFNGAEQ